MFSAKHEKMGVDLVDPALSEPKQTWNRELVKKEISRKVDY